MFPSIRNRITSRKWKSESNASIIAINRSALLPYLSLIAAKQPWSDLVSTSHLAAFFAASSEACKYACAYRAGTNAGQRACVYSFRTRSIVGRAGAAPSMASPPPLPLLQEVKAPRSQMRKMRQMPMQAHRQNPGPPNNSQCLRTGVDGQAGKEIRRRVSRRENMRER